METYEGEQLCSEILYLDPYFIAGCSFNLGDQPYRTASVSGNASICRINPKASNGGAVSQ